MDLRNCTKQELSQMPYEYVREAYYQHNPNAVWILGVFFRHGKMVHLKTMRKQDSSLKQLTNMKVQDRDLFGEYI